MLYYILNGDVFKSQLEGKIIGQLIVVRECLVDGLIISMNFFLFYKECVEFLSIVYGDFDLGKYYEKVVLEFE